MYGVFGGGVRATVSAARGFHLLFSTDYCSDRIVYPGGRRQTLRVYFLSGTGLIDFAGRVEIRKTGLVPGNGRNGFDNFLTFLFIYICMR